MQFKSLQEKLDRSGSAVEMMRNSQTGPYVYPIPAEFSNWRDEQLAWRQGVALMDQSYHMTDLYVEGPDAKRLVSDLGVNTFANFGRNKAKQFITCGHDGHLIGDMILFGLEDNQFNIVGRPTVANWVQFNAETGGYDVTVNRDERTISNPKPRKTFRFELQGPKAWALLEKLNGRALADIKFFNMGEVTVAGRVLRALRHGMGGAPGLEFWGPVELGPQVKARILEAGEEFGLRQVGGRAYSSAAVDSGWIPCPLPAIYSGELMRPYRQWLKADSFDSIASLGGSFSSGRIEDYYFTPWDLDYGRLIKFDHDFVGREALQKRVDEPHRKKVSLVWNPDDVAAIHRSLGAADNGKYMELPTGHYSSYPYDEVLRKGQKVGISTYVGYLFPDRAWVSLAVVDEKDAELGRELTVVWGEERGGGQRPLVEKHKQMEVRATVAAWPFSKLAQEGYRKGPG